MMRIVRKRLLVSMGALIAASFPSAPKAQISDSLGAIRNVLSVSGSGLIAQGDPVGVISPDGRWLAYSVGSRLFVRAVAGGPVKELGAEEADGKAGLTWLPDSRHLAASINPRWRPGLRRWQLYDVLRGTAAPLWPNGLRSSSEASPPNVGEFSQLAWSPQGVAGVTATGGKTMLWNIDASGQLLRQRPVSGSVTALAWAPDGTVACVVRDKNRRRFQRNCGDGSSPDWPHDPWGTMVFSPDGRKLYYTAPNKERWLELWARDMGSGKTERLARMARDLSGPSSTSDGQLLIKSMAVETTAAVLDLSTGRMQPVTSFHGIVHSWHPKAERIGLTVGDWRRYDAGERYPDVEQDLGEVTLSQAPVAKPTRMLLASVSEDQGMSWSPDGRWILLHSHMPPPGAASDKQRSNGIWLLPDDLSAPPRLVADGPMETSHGSWADGGRKMVFSTRVQVSPTELTNRLVAVPFDAVTSTAGAPVDLALPPELVRGGFVMNPVGVPGSDAIVFEYSVGNEKRLHRLSLRGGKPRLLHSYLSQQFVGGISVRPDGKEVAYIARAPDGYEQVFAFPLAGGKARQLTFDPSMKTSPVWAPDGKRIAFSVLRNEAQFWLAAPEAR